ncbi:helix-turn-helix domain-containing protein [Corynebacterium glaucum]|uniref:helix-turn-helix domain-containing protein n=1 Tax=Corynebacterium glaucum TaxID=187491 RepID=UPI0039F60E17
MISLDQWAQIRFLRGQGLSIRKIAAEVGCAKRTVERALASDCPPEYSRRPAKPTTFDPYEPAVRALLAESPRLNAKVIAQRVGWEGSESWPESARSTCHQTRLTPWTTCRDMRSSAT